MLLLSTRCSGSNEIPLDRAVQSSTYSDYFASKALDGNLATKAITTQEDPAWIEFYFKSSSTVDKVVIEKGTSNIAACVYTVSVYDGETGTVCGTYTGITYG